MKYDIPYKIIIIIIFIFFFIISYILTIYYKLLHKCELNFKGITNINSRDIDKKFLINKNDQLIINDPILPENDQEVIVKEIFKTQYNTSNIRYHFEDLFLKRETFKINYSYRPYEKIDKNKSYDDNANNIYSKTGMLNITKLDHYYYGKNIMDNTNFNHIHLSMGHDANYILLSLVTIASILNTTNKETFIHFHFVLLNCTFEDMKPIIALKYINNNVEFIFYNGKQAELDFYIYGKNEKRGVGDYAKFLIPEIANNTNKIIILDSADIIAKKDLSEIYYFDLEDNYFGFTPDIFAGRELKMYLFQRNKFYPNIGICLVNIILFRRDQLYKAGYLSRLAYDNMLCPTQDMFFMISRYKFKFFPLIYNCPQFFNNDEEFLNKKYNNTLINDYLRCQNNSIFKYSLDEILEAHSKQVVNHLFTTKPFNNNANKKNGKIWVEYSKIANVYDKLKLMFPNTFKLYDT